MNCLYPLPPTTLPIWLYVCVALGSRKGVRQWSRSTGSTWFKSQASPKAVRYLYRSHLNWGSNLVSRLPVELASHGPSALTPQWDFLFSSSPYPVHAVAACPGFSAVPPGAVAAPPHAFTVSLDHLSPFRGLLVSVPPASSSNSHCPNSGDGKWGCEGAMLLLRLLPLSSLDSVGNSPSPAVQSAAPG